MSKAFNEAFSLSQRSFLSPSCSNPNCLNYAVTGLNYPKSGKTKQGKQRYRCHRCERIFTIPSVPDDRFKINRSVDQQETRNKQTSQDSLNEVAFSLSHKAVEGLRKLSASFNLDCDEMLEQIGKGGFVLLKRE